MEPLAPPTREAVAVVGMAARLPGAGNVEAFWANLVAGAESITFFTAAELAAAGVDPALVADSAYVPARGAVAGAELFDAAFFGFSPREAEALDPQHRLLLECAWEALEHAGYDPRRYAEPIGVFAGAGANTYLLNNLQRNPGFMEAVGAYQAMLASGGDFLATRISWKLGLRGPSVNVQTACSSSLVAVHLAVQSLLAGECDMALAGGVRVAAPRIAGYLHQPGGVLSPDGHCRAFDAAAGGTVDGEGAGLVVLKRLADALADGDHVHALLLASAVNNDGADKMAYTAPSAAGQAEVVALAQAMAGVEPADIGFVEAHGTGTALGDPIEVAALAQVFAGAPGRRALGSVKSNLGHLDAAAGIASLLKAVLAVERGVIPASLHFTRPNPELDLASFTVPTAAIPWPPPHDGAPDAPRRAGVSSFGIGGTNAHVIVEQPPAAAPGSVGRPRQLLTLAARTELDLENLTADLAAHLARHPGLDLADVAHTLHRGRTAFDHRRTVVAASTADAAEVLSALDPQRVLTRVRAAGERAVAFLFPGQGAQHPGMAAALYAAEPLFRAEIDRGAELLLPALGRDLRPLLVEPAGAAAGGLAAAADDLAQTALAQPALFLVEHALARLWMAWGVRPVALLGHSVGEYVAACLAGVLPFADALRLVAERGRLMQSLPSGVMLAVSLPEAEVRQRLADAPGLDLAAVNAAALCTVAGSPAEVDGFAARLAAAGVETRRLHTSHAFHSAAMEPILDRFAAAFAGLDPRPPAIPYVSNLTGGWIRPEEAADPAYWARHLRSPVRFADGLAALFARHPAALTLEVGPGRALSTLARKAGGRRPGAAAAIASLPAASGAAAADAAVLRALGELWLAGVEIDWAAFHAGERRRRLPLPTYPFDRRRYWVEPAAGAAWSGAAAGPGAATAGAELWAPLWRQTLPPLPLPAAAAGGDSWLLLDGGSGLAAPLAAHLSARGHTVTLPAAGEAADGALLDRLTAAGRTVDRIVHLASAGPCRTPEEEAQRGFWSVFGLARALAERRRDGSPPLRLALVSTGVQQVTDGDPLVPARALLLGLAAVLPQEISGLSCVAVDLDGAAPWPRAPIAALAAEIAAGGEALVAYRGAGRWVRTFEPFRLPAAPPLPRAGGTYLLTGGLGGVGLELAARLAADGARPRLALLTRTPFPGREAWPALAAGPAADLTAQRARRLLALEAAGAEVWTLAADVTDAASLAAALAAVRERWGRIHGAVHAAGVAGGGLVQWRSPADVAAVLAPKVVGTPLLFSQLAAAGDGEAPDFLVLCSSLNALYGGPGQADYAAANAFLDAFARAARAAGPMAVTAINWDAWLGTGMAAPSTAAAADAAAALAAVAEAAEASAALAGVVPFAHPLFYERGTDAAGAAVFAGRLRPSDSWILDDHRLGGYPIVPGTAYLEMAAAAFRALAADGGGAIELRDVVFVTPLRVGDGETREFQAVLAPAAGGRADFRVQSRDAQGWTQHVVGSVGAAPGAAVERLDLAPWIAAWDVEEPGDDYRETLREAGLGPRWEVLKRVHRRPGEVLGLLELAPDLAADVESFLLHPALLDVATSLGEQFVSHGTGFYLPLSYRRLELLAPLPRRLYSHARLRGAAAPVAGETLAFDVTLLDAAGAVCVRIEGFTLKRLDIAATLKRRADGGAPAAAAPPPADAADIAGITPAWAVEAFHRLLAAGLPLPQVAASAEPLPALLARARAATPEAVAAAAAAAAPGGTHHRPDLATPFVAPRTPTEESLAEIWRTLLGLAEVGADDDFFALGGHSLLGTQLMSRVRERLGAEIPLASLFEAATLAQLAALVDRQLAAEGKAAPDAIARQPRGGDFALSFSQERFWFLDRFQPGNAYYNVSQAVRLHGDLSVAALTAAFRAILARHEALRTAFFEVAGSPVQRILDAVDLALPIVDLTALPAVRREAAAERQAVAATARSFDLTRPPLLALTLLRLAPDEHVLALTLHHIVADGWSLVVLLAEIAALYPAALSGAPAALPPLAIQYVDYAAWQRQALAAAGSATRDQLDYWRRQLGGPAPLLNLPTDRPRPPAATFAGATHHLTLPAALVTAWKSLCVQEGATPFMGLLAVLALLLQRWSGEDEIRIGSPVAGRERREVEHLIGLFINTLVLRLDLAGDPPFRQLLGRVRSTALAAFARQEVPIEALVAELQPERDDASSGLFRVLFNMQDFPRGRHDLPGLTLSGLPLREAPSKFDLTVYVGEVGGELVFELLYKTALFDPARIAALSGQLHALIRQAVAAPGEPISRYSLLAAETAAVLPDPAAPLPAPAFPSLAAQLRRAAALHADLPALVAPDGVWTYRELDQRAAALARDLVARGAGRGETVAVLGPRGPELVAAVTGVVLAGAVLLALDRRLPPRRLLALWQAAGRPRHLVLAGGTAEDELAWLPAGHPLEIFAVPSAAAAAAAGAAAADDAAAGLCAEPGAPDPRDLSRPLLADSDPDGAAYLVFTSGSTGAPKGIVGRRRGLTHFLAWQRDRFAVVPGDRVAQLTSPVFDAVLREIFLPLTSGAALVLPPDELPADQVISWLAGAGVTLLHTVPSLAAAWLAAAAPAATTAIATTAIATAAAPAAPAAAIATAAIATAATADAATADAGGAAPAAPPALRWVFLSGEPLEDGLVNRLRRRLPRARIANFYGPSETTLIKSWCEVPDPAPPGLQAAGLPLPDTQLLVLAADGRLCGVSEAGEIAIRTPFASLGYLDLPAETARRFRASPFAGEAGDRLYLTGDRGRYRPDGSLEILGRLDDQIKVRGVRVEPAETAAAVAAHPGVAASAVVARPDPGTGGRRLVAYVVPAAGAARDADALRLWLHERLPEAFLPAAVVWMEALPLGATGKLDRAALPAPEAAAAAAATPGPAAAVAAGPERSPLEELLHDLWCQLLQLDQIGRDQSFFELGGHSLLAMQVIARVRQLCGVELPLRGLFETPTLAGLAASIATLQGGAAAAEAPPLLPRPPGAELPLSFAQQRLWFLAQLEPESAAYHLPAGFELTGEIAPGALATALRRVAARHEILRTTFPGGAGEPLQQVAPPAAAAGLRLPVVDLTALGAAHAAAALHLAQLDAERPFDLARGPVVRALLLALPPAAAAPAAPRHRFFATLHHIVSDAWSQRLLLRDLVESYRELAAGRAGALPPLAVQYGDFTLWQRAWLSGAALERQLAYWRERLAGLATLALPGDRPLPPRRSGRGGEVALTLPAALVGRLAAASRGQGSTLFMALLSGFQALLGRYGGQTDFALGVPVANRRWRETEEMIGLFANTLVLRADLGGDPTFAALLARQREATLAAFAHQDVPFERLVEELQPARSLSSTPLFQALFAFQNVPLPLLPLPGVVVAPLAEHHRSAKFDLTLTLQATDDRGAVAPLAGLLRFAADLFDRATARRLASHLASLLAAAVAAPDTPLSALPLLDAAERAALLREWNDLPAAPEPFAGELPSAVPAAPEPSGEEPPAAVPAAFAAQAARTPDAVAVRLASGAALSYGDLAARVTRLAAVLRRAGAGPERMVAVALGRSADLVAAALAVWQAGGAYLPLDPGEPPVRRAAILADARPAVLLHRGAAAGLDLDAAPAAQVIDLDRLATLTTDAAEAAPAAGDPGRAAPVSGDPGRAALACVIYTSGSTGRPKGVLVSHGSLADYLRWVRTTLLPDAAAWLPLLTRPGFDASWKQLVAPLLRGGAVWVLDEETLARPGALLAALAAAPPGAALNCVPSFWSALLDAAAAGDGPLPTGLAALLLGGEALPPALVARTRALLPRLRLVNLYGPTEATANASWAELALPPGPFVPLGRPLPGTRLYVLDAAQQPVPLGVAGELAIGGGGLARGYLGRPERTAASFLPDPWSPLAGARLYRTGDRVRRLASGELLFLGRLDRQVKIRGLRLELGEIEAALAAHPELRASALALVAAGDEPLLVAAVVPASAEPADAAPLAGRLRAWLAARLPPAAVPSRFLVLPALPRLPSGKVDARALADLAAAAPEPADPTADGMAERSPVEEILAAIWEEVLGVSGVTPEDDFFALGGHSLRATQVLSRLCRTFTIDLPLRALFEAPRLADLARSVEHAVAGGTPPVLPPLVARRRGGAAPLSFAQQRLWLADRLAPGGVAYNVPLSVRLRGRLDVAALRRALTAVVARHEALRTRFVEVDGEPLQRIDPPAAVAVHEADLTALGAPLAPAEAARLAAREARRPFDLATGPLLRCLLVREGADLGTLVLTLHHIVSDAWSLGILVRDLADAYQGRAVAPLAVQYADFAAWQRGWLRGETLAALLAHWRQRLAGVPAVLPLPADRPRLAAPVRSPAGSFVVPLPPVVAGGLRELLRQARVTPFMALLAGFQALLGRLCGVADLAVGSPIANRNHQELEGLIGFFVNILVLRADLGGAPTVGDLLARTRDAALAAYTHQDLPFERLVEDLHPARDAARPPLVQAIFALQNAPPPRLVLPELAFEPAETGSREAKFDLSVAVTAGDDDDFAVRWEYDAGLFDGATVRRWADHYVALLAAMTVDAGAAGAAAPAGLPLARLPMLSAAGRHQLLVEWNDAAPAAAPPAGATVDRRVAAWIAATPAAVAVEYGDHRLTYGELGRQADRLSARLRRLGAGEGDIVAVLLERSADLVATLLAVLRIGAAYLPLDPDHPAARQATVLADAGAAVLVTRRALAALLPGHAVRTLVIDEPSEAAAASGGQPLAAAPRAASGPLPPSLAYVIYTSGSTGVPKGVAVPHRAVLHLLDDGSYAPLTAADRVAQVSTAAFDAATFEIWGPLTAGGTLVGISRYDALFPPDFAAELAARAITALFLTASLFNEVVRRAPAAFAGVRHLLVGGEALTPSVVRDLLAGRPPERLLNAYGPTECTTFSLWRRITAVAAGAATVPIGRPLAGTRAYVLDAALRPVPPGSPGELWLGGDGLARGYLGAPAATAERFRPDSLSGAPGARLYGTGDRVRFAADGAVDLLGRADHQVKVRGFRVELGEVEAAIRRHPLVRDAVVVVREDPGGDSGGRSLVAYVTRAAGGAAPASGDFAADLRASLRQLLPQPMIPAELIELPALPLTATGKVDRRQLPTAAAGRVDHRRRPVAAAAAGRERGRGHAAVAAAPAGDAPPPPAAQHPTDDAPRNPVEELLAGIWSAVLRRDRIGVHESFLDLGGHSLLAIQVTSRVREAFGVDLPIRSALETPTIAALAGQIEELLRAGRHASLPPLTPRERGAELPLSFAQERLWFLDQIDPGLPAYNIPLVLHVSGALHEPTLRRALLAVVARHEALRTRFLAAAGRPYQVIDPPRLELPVVDLSGPAAAAAAWEAAVDRAARDEARRRFDLGCGPLLRVTLLRRAADEHVLLVTLHHVVADGWSLDVLVRDLTAIYSDLLERREPGLPPLLVQYPDYALWQRRWLAGETLAELLRFWSAALAGAPPRLALPLDRPLPAVQTFRGASQRLDLPAALDGGLRAMARGERVTPFMALLAAWAAVLHRYSGQSDLVIGTPVANRGEIGTEDLIGFFVNTLALRLRPHGGLPWKQLLAAVRETTLAAYAHQELPFERLVEELRPRRDLGLTPLFQVLFAMYSAPPRALSLPGLAIRSLPTGTGSAKFALTLSLVDTSGGLAGALEYNRDLFDRTTAARLAAHFTAQLAAAVAAPEHPLYALSPLSAAECHQLLREWNDAPPAAAAASAGAPAAEPGIHRGFLAQAARRPGAAALVAADGELTYGELAGLAERLARRLVALGVGPEVPVGIFLERTPALIAAMLGVLLAGGAYVPLDPAYPAERLQAMLEDSGARVVVAAGALPAPLAAALPGLRTLLVDAAGAPLADAPAAPLAAAPAVPLAAAPAAPLAAAPAAPPTPLPPLPAVAPENLAYIIFTSGSTGRPKGVAISHGSAAALLAWAGAAFTPAELAGVLAATSVCFDLSVFEIFAPLSHGGTLILADNAMALAGLPAAGRVTLINTVPSAISALLHLEAVPPSAATILLAGEPLFAGLVARLNHETAVERVWNLYGPSEDTTYSTGCRVPPDGRAPAIGRPVAGSRLRLLDSERQPIPPGAVGEIHLGGAGLARGYFGRPDLTAAVFQPDPWSGAPGARLYRTGDHGRLRADGELEFLGRADHQVKVRGFRIELGEIEAHLARRPDVLAAAVLAREDHPGERRLVAYVVLRPGAAATGADLRQALRASLPDHMVPAAWVELAELPLTPGGKIDRAALPPPAGTAAGAVAPLPGDAAPRTEIERVTAAVWCEVLHRDQVGVHDSFFDLGGHSLLLAQVLAALRERLGARLSMVDLFRYPTIAALAEHLGRTAAAAPQPLVDARDRAGRRHEAAERARHASLARRAVATPAAVAAPTAEAVPAAVEDEP